MGVRETEVCLTFGLNERLGEWPVYGKHRLRIAPEMGRADVKQDNERVKKGRAEVQACAGLAGSARWVPQLSVRARPVCTHAWQWRRAMVVVGAYSPAGCARLSC